MINLYLSWNHQEIYGFLVLFRGFRSEFIRLISLKIRSGIWRLSRCTIPLCQISRSISVDFPMRLPIHQQLRKSVKTIMDVIFPSDLLSVDLVSHFTQLVSVYILWKQEKTTGFLIFWGSIEIDLLHELG